MTAPRLRRVLGPAIALLLTAALVVWLVGQREHLADLQRIDAATLAAVYAISLAGTLVSGRAIQVLLARLGAQVSFLDMVLLQNASTALAFLPMKGATLLRAGYLRRRYGIDYARLGAFLVLLTILSLGISSAIAAASLIASVDLAGEGALLLAGLLVVFTLLALAVAAVPLPRRWQPPPRLRGILALRQELTARPAAWAEPTLLLVVHYLLAALRLGLIYRGLGIDLDAAGALVLAAVGVASLLISITPGALGIRELALGGGAFALGIPLELGMLVALVERAIGLSWALVVGVPAVAALLRRLRAV